jgi:hypothetical protein
MTINFGEHNGKKLVAVHRNEDGTMDFETDDGMIYKNCVMTNYSVGGDNATVIETVEIKNIQADKADMLKAFGYEEEE